jgi:DNA-binding MarR family transcriptional regulator
MPLSKTDYETLAEFRHALRQFGAFSEAQARSLGLTAQQHQALLAIRGFPGRQAVTVGELAERLGIRPNSAVGLVNRLAAENWVTRSVDPADRRQVLVSLAPQGLALLEQLSSAHRAELRRIGPRLRELLESLED